MVSSVNAQCKLSGTFCAPADSPSRPNRCQYCADADKSTRSKNATAYCTDPATKNHPACIACPLGIDWGKTVDSQNWGTSDESKVAAANLAAMQVYVFLFSSVPTDAFCFGCKHR